MDELERLRRQNIELLGRVGELTASVGQLTASVASLTAEIASLRRKLEESERAAHRQAAPFRRPEKQRSSTPKPPGRKKGHEGAQRSLPEAVDLDLSAPPIDRCPACGAQTFDDPREHVEFIEEILPARPHVTRVVSLQARCSCCQTIVRSAHPLSRSGGRNPGAAGTRLGDRARAAIVTLQRRGLTLRSACRVLGDLTGLRVSPGAAAQTAQRVADTLAPEYDQLARRIAHNAVVHADETSWWQGGKSAWLWVFASPGGDTLYHIDERRGRAVVTEMLGGESFGGVLVSDCLATYDDATPRQHKCYAHHLKAISKAIEEKPGSEFLGSLRVLLRAAMAAKSLRAEVPPEDYKDMCERLERRADELLLPTREAGEERIANRLRRQRDHLFTFLYDDAVDATNNLAERQLRPAVIQRKLSCGNKTERGAHTFTILASLAATAARRGEDILQYFLHSLTRSPVTAG